MKNKSRIAALLIAIGIVYGDIGTSPLYVMKSITGSGQPINEGYILGVLSAIIWALTLVTTLKYIIITLKANNHGEGGIFSLYTLVRNNGKWLLTIAIIGGSALLADSVLTPAVSISSAVEGLREIPSPIIHSFFSPNNIIIIVLIIIGILFGIQRFGTDLIGRFFGPIMFIWFAFLAIIGFFNIGSNLIVLKAFNPYYAIHLLTTNPRLIFIVLGSVLLATTGAESIYSDLGHVGRKNILLTWPFVKIALIINYLGQGAWILNHRDNVIGNPFYQCIPSYLLVFSILLATIASIIASQALITGTYTLISEAMALNLFPKINIRYPSRTKGQVYIPFITLLLWIACSGIVLYFRTSDKMEAAYGLAITITMIQTTTLLYQYMKNQKKPKIYIYPLIFIFYTNEILFLVSSLKKFLLGGYVALIIAIVGAILMFVWYRGSEIKYELIKEVSIKDVLVKLKMLKNDSSYQKTAMNIAYLSSNEITDKIDRNIVSSILNYEPKRADVYWFINVNVSDDPYTCNYTLETYNTDYIMNIQINLGFRIEQNIDLFLKTIAKDLIKKQILKKQNHFYSIEDNALGDFKYIIIQEKIGAAADINKYEKLLLRAKFFIKKFTGDPTRWFGLKYSNTSCEQMALSLPKKKVDIYRLKNKKLGCKKEEKKELNNEIIMENN